jgi:5'-3' exonuclease
VPGIGDKTAAELLQRFGSLEAVLASVDRSRAPSASRT